MIKELLEDAKIRMEKVEKILVNDFSIIRAGRATPALLDRMMIDYYGTPTPINQIATISCPEPRQLLIQPWDKNNLGVIEKAILKSDIGITPSNDGMVIRLTIPHLTEERRKELVKQCAQKTEEARVAIRNIRRHVNESIKKMEKEKECSEDEAQKGQEDVQKLTDKMIKQVEEIFLLKEKEIMEV